MTLPHLDTRCYCRHEIRSFCQRSLLLQKLVADWYKIEFDPEILLHKSMNRDPKLSTRSNFRPLQKVKLSQTEDVTGSKLLLRNVSRLYSTLDRKLFYIFIPHLNPYLVPFFCPFSTHPNPPQRRLSRQKEHKLSRFFHSNK